MLFCRLAHADVADGCSDQNSFGTFQRAQHDLNRKFAPILPVPDEFKPRADLLRQCIRRRSQIIRNQPLRKSFRDQALHFLPDEFIAAISELFLCLNVQQDDLSTLIHHHHRIRSRFQQSAVSAFHLR